MTGAEPRWLTPQQQQAWLALTAVVTWLPAALETQLQRDAGITHVEYAVLSWLSMSPDRTARMSEIAAAANVTLSHLSRIATRLEKRGWMRREPDPADGRATLAILTPTGWDKITTTAPGHANEVQRLVFDTLTPTQTRQLHDISEKILHTTRPDHRLRLPPTPADSEPAPPSPAESD